MDRKWVTFVVLFFVLAGGSALIAIAGGSSGGDGGTLKVEQAQLPGGGVEILVTVPEDINVPDTTNGKTSVDLVCTDDGGDTVVRARQTWPLLRDGDPPAPHAHQPTTPAEIKSVARCRITGTKPELSAELGLAR